MHAGNDAGSQAAPPAGRPAYHHENLRAALLAVARTQLEAAGTADLSLRSVARAAGVSSAAPAYHFRNKAGLLAQLAVEGFAELMQRRLLALGTTAPPREKARQMLSAYVGFAIANPRLFDLMFGLRILHRQSHADLQTVGAASFKVFLGAISRYAEHCGWPAADWAEVTHAAWAVEHGLATLLLSGNAPAQSAPVQPERLISLAIDLFLSSVAAGPPGDATGSADDGGAGRRQAAARAGPDHKPGP